MSTTAEAYGIRINDRVLTLEEACKSSSDLMSPTRMFTLPGAGLSYSIAVRGLVRRGIKALDLSMLTQRYQLQYLHVFKVGDRELTIDQPHTFPHTRFEHSLGAAALAVSIMLKSDLSPVLIKLGVLAEIAHDRMMPAGGDAVKNYAFQRGQLKLFDEDRNFQEIFLRKPDAWRQLRDDERLPVGAERIIEDAVQSKGILGKIHDVADTSSYIALDVAYLLQECPRLWGPNWRQEMPDVYKQILALVEQGACRLWENVMLTGDAVVINDVKRLEQFLMLRALLWRHLYHQPMNKFLEGFHTDILFPYMARRNLIPRDKIVHWHDNQLDRLIERTFGFERGQMKNVNLMGKTPHRHFFISRDVALAHEEDYA